MPRVQARELSDVRGTSTCYGLLAQDSLEAYSSDEHDSFSLARAIKVTWFFFFFEDSKIACAYILQ